MGHAYGEIRGTNYLKTSTSNETTGNIKPDWVGGINNTLKYKNIALSFLVDLRQGGNVFSTDMYHGLATGLYEETAGSDDLGNSNRGLAANQEGFIRPGVTQDGKPNTKRVNNSNYGAYGYSVNPDAGFIYDASYVKLREASLSYSIPASFVSRLKVFKGIDISLIGRNPWIINKRLPYSDPEEGLSSGNIQGYQVGAYPTVRTVALNLKLNF